jgi:hypothetical protein
MCSACIAHFAKELFCRARAAQRPSLAGRYLQRRLAERVLWFCAPSAVNQPAGLLFESLRVCSSQSLPRYEQLVAQLVVVWRSQKYLGAEIHGPCAYAARQLPGSRRARGGGSAAAAAPCSCSSRRHAGQAREKMVNDITYNILY